ncbi:hypothetical protein BCV70DRAFT_189420 [Testicularia cyperi]|uniref:Conserved oligomeric Golgi complex subunit 1 n=1 Tax=Testicularia cyperi TaxID=1882483 RepID=A0A317XSN0_9BASI|nr:hypothetical protein BCV70DRAFT_189420 [Testicularia cyperi]
MSTPGRTRTQPVASNSSGLGAEVTSPTSSHSSTTLRTRAVGHTRTNASLTSGISPSAMLSSATKRNSGARSASLFESTGLDPMRIEPDTLFTSLGVKDIERYQRAVRDAALEKQHELRSLVGQRYEDLLGTANTIIDMSNSSNQLLQRLESLSNSVAHADESERNQAQTMSKKARRASYLPVTTTQTSSPTDDHHEQDAELDRQEAVFALGASLKLIMDSPEFVWRCVERGKTLHAAWTFMLARAAWWELIEKSPLPVPQASLSTDIGITSATEAVTRLKINVKRAFPFIEKQWQSMVPMRKQIVHRAVALLMDSEIESMAVADQLSTLVLLDGNRYDHVFQLLLSQRQAAMRRTMHRRRASSSLIGQQQIDATRLAPASSTTTISTSAQALTTSSVALRRLARSLTELIKVYAKTLQHAVQMFIQPDPARADDSHHSLLHSLLTATLDAAHQTQHTRDPTFSPSASLSPLPSPENERRPSAAAMRAARRRSSYGVPGGSIGASNATVANSSSNSGMLATTKDARKARVSTDAILQSLPSSQILLRLLPSSIWTFSPRIDLEQTSPEQCNHLLDELCNWAAKTRDEFITGTEHAQESSTKPSGSAPQNKAANNSNTKSIRSSVQSLHHVSELTALRRAFTSTLAQVRRTVLTKLKRAATKDTTKHHAILTRVEKELLSFQQAVDSVLHQRLDVLLAEKLSKTTDALLFSTKEAVSAIQTAAQQASMVAARASPGPTETSHDPVLSIQGVRRPLQSVESTRLQSAALQKQLHGRTPLIDNLIGLYEEPVGALSDEIEEYVEDLRNDSTQHDSITNILSSFASAIETSNRLLIERLQDLIKSQIQGPSDVAPLPRSSAKKDLQVRLPGLSPTDANEERASEPLLERFWLPSVRSHVLEVMRSSRVYIHDETGQSSESPSPALVLAFVALAESVLQLGPALVGKESLSSIRAVLQAIKSTRSETNDSSTQGDIAAIDALLSGEMPADLGDRPQLRRLRLVLVPLLSQNLSSIEQARQQDSQTGKLPVLSADPASAARDVLPLVKLAKSKAPRFQSLPMRS